MSLGKVLIVDDEPDMLELLQTELISEGYEVVSAQSGLEAIDHARGSSPDLILMDILLPDISGADAVKQMKADPNLARIPVLFLTAIVTKTEEHRDQLGIHIEDQWHRAIAKPINHQELLGAVKESIKPIED